MTTRHVSHRYRLSFLYAPCESPPQPWRDHPGDGRWHHGSFLDRPGIVVVSCATVALDTTHEARASLTCTQVPDGTMVWKPRLAVELPRRENLPSDPFSSY